MKVLHAPFCFYPDPAGGTEVYVKSLCDALHLLGLEVVVAAPAEQNAFYSYENIPVRRYAIASQIDDVSAIYGLGDAEAAANFAHILDDEKPDIVHLHALTRGVSVLVAREAKRRGIPVVLTYHTPTVSCPRGTLLRWGSEVCDGHLLPGRCTRCKLNDLGLSRAVSAAISLVPPSVGKQIGRWGKSGSLWTGLRMPELVRLRQNTFFAMAEEADRIVALCEWTRALLTLNGIAKEKVTLCRHGLLSTLYSESAASEIISPNKGQLRLAFLGRIDSSKGIHVILEALSNQRTVTLDVYGTLQAGGEAYQRKLLELIGSRSHIRFLPPIANVQVIPTLREYDALVVPSQVLETGPLVVLEAFAAGIPVIGSNLGGIAELVQHEVNGLLVEPASSISAWQNTLQRLIDDAALITHLREAIKPPRTMAIVADEMRQLYISMLPPNANYV